MLQPGAIQVLLYADFVLAYEFRLNGAAATRDSLNPNQPLLYILRNALGLNGPKFGSGLGPLGRLRCIDRWKNHALCITPVRQVADKTMMTLEGRGSQDKLDPAQAALIAEQAGRSVVTGPTE